MSIASPKSSRETEMGWSGSGSLSYGTRIVSAIWLRAVKPMRMHSRAEVLGGLDGSTARWIAAASMTAINEVTQWDKGRGERKRTSDTYVVCDSPTSAAHRSHVLKRSSR